MEKWRRVLGDNREALEMMPPPGTGGMGGPLQPMGNSAHETTGPMHTVEAWRGDAVGAGLAVWGGQAGRRAM